MNFFARHPFIASLVKLWARITVGFNAVMLCFVALAITLSIIGAAFYAAFNDGGIRSTSEYVYGDGDGANTFLSIKVTGTIIGDSDDTNGVSSDENYTPGYDVKQELYDAADDDSIAGVVLEINSPGGTIYGAHAIADGVAHYKKKTHNPVIAYVQGMGASGAYWAAVSADKIVADYGSDVGSIGVIQGPFQYYDTPVSDGSGVVTQNGIQTVTVTAGTSKDVGNPYRKLTATEIAVLQQSVNNDYDLFVQYVSEQRGISEETIRTKIGAMPYDNKTAQIYNLIDQTGSRQDAYDLLAKEAHVATNDYQIIRDTYYTSLQYGSGSWLAGVANSLRGRQTQAKTAKPVDACALTRTNMAFYGDITKFCSQSQ